MSMKNTYTSSLIIKYIMYLVQIQVRYFALTIIFVYYDFAVFIMWVKNKLNKNRLTLLIPSILTSK